MSVFKLELEPLDFQVSVHINNLFNTYPRFQVMSTYDFLKESQFKFIFDEMRPSNDMDRMSYNLYGMVKHYGISRMDAAFTELFGENVEPIKVIKPRKMKGTK